MSFFHFEDYDVGALDDFGHVTFTTDQAAAFRRRYDPAPEGRSLSVSLWHLTATWMGLKVRAMQAAARAVGAEPGYAFSPGVRDVERASPAPPGERLHFTGLVRSKRLARSLDGWGVIEGDTQVFGEDRRLALRFRGFHFAPLRAQ